MTHDELPERWGDDIRPWRLLELLASEPAIGPAFNALGRVLVDTIDHRMLETIALRVSARRGNEYAWRGHVHLSTTRLRVLTREEVAGIAEGPAALTGADAALVRAVDEVLDGGLAPASRAVLGAVALRVTIAAGFYDAVATLMKDAEPEDDIPAVPGLETPARAARTRRSRSAA